MSLGDRGEAAAALEPYRPGVDGPFGHAEAGHLLRRACFGGTPGERARIVDLGPERAAETCTASPPPQGDYAEVLAALEPLASVDSVDLSRALWVTRMLRDPHPFRELLALFWHGHFATSVEKVGRVHLLVRQLETLRARGAGPFGELVKAVSRDPAMILWLDGNRSRRHHPNENYARELMELFTLGRGHYTEDDVLEAARAFTGWHEHGGRFRFNAHEHDEDQKQVLGRTGALDGDDVVDACLAHPNCARHVGGRLFRYFVRPDPDDALLDEIGTRYRESGYDTLGLVRLLLCSRAFYAPRARRAIVRSPVALAVGSCRALELKPDATELAERVALLGQALYAPPSVKGWDGGDAWLNAATLVGRLNLAGWLAGHWADSALPDATSGALADRLFDGAPPPSLAEALADGPPDVVGTLHLLLASPEHQLA
ncbi:MAG: DUF1800 domain-containing protein [Planctomycetota bacterium]